MEKPPQRFEIGQAVTPIGSTVRNTLTPVAPQALEHGAVYHVREYEWGAHVGQEKWFISLYEKPDTDFYEERKFAPVDEVNPIAEEIKELTEPLEV